VLDRFFTVLTITPSFLIRFWPVKCRIEALIMLFRMVKEWSVRFSFWSSQRSGQTLVKLGRLWSNLVKFGQSSPNSRKCIPDHLSRVSGHGGPYSDRERLGRTLVNTWSTLVKLGQSSPISGKCVPDHVLRLFGVISLRRIRPPWFGLSRFTCRHPRKSRG
jgi:hypothetical protein